MAESRILLNSMSRLRYRTRKIKPFCPQILIVSEDSKSSVYYLKEKIRSKGLNPDDVHVTGESDSAPIKVVDYAIKLKKERLKNPDIPPYSEIYCVMDVDEHTTLKAAINKAKANYLIPIISNECFELWYLLHFEKYSTKHRKRVDLKKELVNHLGKDYEKGDDSIFQILDDSGFEENAIDNAEKLETYATGTSTQRDPLINPTTEVYKLIRRINAEFK